LFGERGVIGAGNLINDRARRFGGSKQPNRLLAKSMSGSVSAAVTVKRCSPRTASRLTALRLLSWSARGSLLASRARF
jgi:hypothetical protein